MSLDSARDDLPLSAADPTLRDDTAQMVAWLRSVVEGDRDAALFMTIDRSAQAWISWGSDVQAHPNGAQIADTPEIYVAQFIARHDPADVIADCEAKLMLIESAEDVLRPYLGDHYEDSRAEGVREVLYTLASAYRHREGWQDWWTP